MENRSSSGEFHVFEKYDPNGHMELFKIEFLSEQTSKTILQLKRLNTEEIYEMLVDLNKKGFYPEKIYVGAWSKMKLTFIKIWPEAKILMEYNG
jgi:hypothetical protein